MWGMAGMGSVITVSPYVHVADLEQIAKTRVARDGVSQLAAATADTRQCKQLRRLRDRLITDPGLDVFYGDHPDGTTCLTVYPAGQRQACIWGGPKGVAEDDPDDVTVEILPDDFFDDA